MTSNDGTSDSTNTQSPTSSQVNLPLTRPNGKQYRPRKPGLQAHWWDNWALGIDERQGVVIFGTLDIEAARSFATEMCEYWFGRGGVTEETPGWFRLAPRHGEWMWTDDPSRGRPGVMFTAAEAA